LEDRLMPYGLLGVLMIVLVIFGIIYFAKRV
jgi:hypothetical protein